MAKYEVVRPWFGVKVGDVVDIKEPHSALEVERSSDARERRVVT